MVEIYFFIGTHHRATTSLLKKVLTHHYQTIDEKMLFRLIILILTLV